MAGNKLQQFLHDERGAYSLWSLVWFLLYLVVGGLSVDVTDAYRNMSMLQSTADAAALAAIMSTNVPGEDPIEQANTFAAANMDPDIHGDVLDGYDVVPGVWDFGAQSFTPLASPPNAVHVETRRAIENSNPVGTTFLRVLGIFGINPQWNVNTDSIAVGAVSTCHNNGLIAGGKVTQTNANGFFENICVHGVEGLYLRNQDYFESGVAASTTCRDCIGPEGLDPSTNEGWDEAWWRGGANDALFPYNAYAVGDYVDALRDLPNLASYNDMLSTYGNNYAGWDYLFHSDGSPPARYTGTNLPATLQTHTIYEIDCAGSEFQLPETKMRNLAIVLNCKTVAPSSKTMDMVDTILAVDWIPGDPTTEGIQLASGGRFGIGNCGHQGVEIYTNGTTINFAAGGDVNMVRLLSAWDIRWAANATGRVGVMAEAVNDIIIRTDSDFGLCPGSTVNGPNQLTYRLVQ